jgi:hypothetical protein
MSRRSGAIDNDRVSTSDRRSHPVDLAADGHFIFEEQEITGSKFPEHGAEIGLQPA